MSSVSSCRNPTSSADSRRGASVPVTRPWAHRRSESGRGRRSGRLGDVDHLVDRVGDRTWSSAGSSTASVSDIMPKQAVEPWESSATLNAAPGGRREREHPLDLRPGEIARLAEARHVRHHEVDATHHLGDDCARQRAGEHLDAPASVWLNFMAGSARGLVVRSWTTAIRADRVVDVGRDAEPDRDPLVAAGRRASRPDVHRHGHAECVERGRVVAVVAGGALDDRRHEQIVDRVAVPCCGVVEFVEVDLVDVEVASRIPLGEERRQHGATRREEAHGRGAGPGDRCGGAHRVARRVEQRLAGRQRCRGHRRRVDREMRHVRARRPIGARR